MQLLCISTSMYKNVANVNLKCTYFNVHCGNIQINISIILFFFAFCIIEKDHCHKPEKSEHVKNWAPWQKNSAFCEKRILHTPQLLWLPLNGQGKYKQVGKLVLLNSQLENVIDATIRSTYQYINVSAWSQSPRCAVLCSEDFYWNTTLHQFRHQQ